MSEERQAVREVAWFAWVPGIVDGSPEDERVGVYRAATRSKARYQCLRSAIEASFYDVKLSDIKVRRAPEFDDAEFRSGVMPKYIRRTSERTQEPER